MEVSSPSIIKDRVRPRFPKQAVITAGMPYGNKDLHFGHVGGVFVAADAYARFLRGRIGAHNVIFISGTDCYGSPIVATYSEQVEAGRFSGSLEEFVKLNHDKQRDTLQSFFIDIDCYGASALEPFRAFHVSMGTEIIEALYRHGHLEKRSTTQFYDSVRNTFLSGREVVGRCPIEGCPSEKAYADECSLGHQYEPKDLISPKSIFTGELPDMREVTNWYLPMEPFRDALFSWITSHQCDKEWSEFAIKAVLEYFEPPTIHVNREQIDSIHGALASLPEHNREIGKGKSDRLLFRTLRDQETAKDILSKYRVRFRTGKTLVPFRLTGNLEWGLPVPELQGLGNLTFWVWPESLWAPISFTKSLLEKRGRASDDWRSWWCSKNSTIFQFIGEDNLYFYALAEIALFIGTQGSGYSTDAPEGQLQLPYILANRHLLFLDKKASSSGAVRAPLATDLLKFYTPDQLRIHFLSLNLAIHNVSFRPKPLDPTTSGGPDPVLKDGHILTNAFNQAVRSCFYTAQKYYDRRLPPGTVCNDVIEESEGVILDFEELMAQRDFRGAIDKVSAYIRKINIRWSNYKPFREECDEQIRSSVVLDAFHMVRVATTLMHPIAPAGTETIREYLRVGKEIWSWNYIFHPLESFFSGPGHQFKHLPPKLDFFEKLDCQLDISLKK